MKRRSRRPGPRRRVCEHPLVVVRTRPTLLARKARGRVSCSWSSPWLRFRSHAFAKPKSKEKRGFWRERVTEPKSKLRDARSAACALPAHGPGCTSEPSLRDGTRPTFRGIERQSRLRLLSPRGRG